MLFETFSFASIYSPGRCLYGVNDVPGTAGARGVSSEVTQTALAHKTKTKQVHFLPGSGPETFLMLNLMVQAKSTRAGASVPAD